jgi:hypothetical protein
MYRPRGTPALLRQHIALALFLPDWSEPGEVGGRRRFYAEKSSHLRQDLSFPARTFRQIAALPSCWAWKGPKSSEPFRQWTAGDEQLEQLPLGVDAKLPLRDFAEYFVP